jgi:disulfide bond formation protein DsbB
MAALSSLAHRLLAPQAALAVIVLAAAGLVAGAWFFQLVVGLAPCPLCLLQRWPHYLALALGVAMGGAAAWGALGVGGARWGALVLALIFAVSAALGGYHAGVEWGWFQGPADCAAGAAAPTAATMEDFMRQLQGVRVVSCANIPWSFLGLSLAGWNAVTSLGLSAYGALAWHRSAARVQGSSSLSQ